MRFNRNIVECKEIHHAGNGENALCFNRNIVECKVAPIGIAIGGVSVLIETLWNVKY